SWARVPLRGEGGPSIEGAPGEAGKSIPILTPSPCPLPEGEGGSSAIPVHHLHRAPLQQAPELTHAHYGNLFLNPRRIDACGEAMRVCTPDGLLAPVRLLRHEVRLRGRARNVGSGSAEGRRRLSCQAG